MKSLIYRLTAIALVATTLAAFGSASALAQDAAPAEYAMTEKADDAAHDVAEAEVTVVDLTQTPGQFTTESLTLAPGRYRFVVANDGVDHDLGFVIQRAEDKDGDLMATAVENSFTTAPIADGESQSTGVVTLTPGEYVYSCPLNPTPHYTITVE